MKKILATLCILLLISACSNKEKALYEEGLSLYKSYWTVILDQEHYQSSSNLFNIEASIADGEYVVIVDQARIAMYDVEIMVIENAADFSTEKMMPSSGIFESIDYDLIPNQTRENTQFVGGFRLVGESTDDLTVQVMVSWKNLAKTETVREFFEFELVQ